MTERGVTYLESYLARDPDITSTYEKRGIGWQLPPEITVDEWRRSVLTPRPIVPAYLYADVALLVAPGGAGKTTLQLWEGIHVVLGRSLYGREPGPAGPVVIVTAEDAREQLVARLRLIAEAMNLTPAEIEVVMRDVRISDVSGEGLKLTTVVGEAVIPSASVDILIAELQAIQPVLVVFDPAVSFGIGEARVNDAEQGLVDAARRVRNALTCCVRYIAHTGKGNAREKTLDQYTSRGGSALPDGARMVAVLQPMSADEWSRATGASLAEGETGMVLALPKLTYCPPQPDILIMRKGYGFTHTRRLDVDAGELLSAHCAQLIQAVEHAAARGERPTQNSLEAQKIMPRMDLRAALATLIARGRLVKAKDTKHGGAQHYLQLVAAPEASGAPNSDHA